MAENKKSFVLYADLLHTVQKLPDEKAGVLLKTILGYVNDLNPEVNDLLVDLVFEPIKQQLKRDLKKYKSFSEKQSLNGKLGGRPKKKENPKNPSLLEENHETQKSLNVNVNVNDTVNVNEDEEVKKLNANFITFYSAGTHLTFDGEFGHYAYKQTLKTKEQLKSLVAEFLIEQSAVGKLTWQNVKDLRMHFINWAKKQTVKSGAVYTGPSKKVINHNPERNVA